VSQPSIHVGVLRYCVQVYGCSAKCVAQRTYMPTTIEARH